MKRRLSAPLTVLSTFTGAGGLDLGLECAGFQTIGCIELDERARDTIIANRPYWNLLETGDILQTAYELEPSAFDLTPGELSVLAGAPPCQPYSTAAQWAERGRVGIDDPRSLSLLAFLHLAEMFLPQVILIENVPGFVLGRSAALDIVRDELQRINAAHRTAYALDLRILSADDFGVPQRRRRAIIVARRDGLAFDWPTPTHTNNPVRAGDALGDITPSRIPTPKGQWADLLATIPAGMNYQYHTARGEGEPLFGHRRWFWSFLLKLSPEQPSWTIPAQAGPATGPFHWDNRPLAVEELARLQSFPSCWVFEGGDVAKRRQIGNATPPLLAEAVGRAIAKSVFGRRFRRSPKLQIARAKIIPVAPAPISIPQRFLSRLNEQQAHPGVGLGPGAARRHERLLLSQFALGLYELQSRERLSVLENTRRQPSVLGTSAPSILETNSEFSQELIEPPHQDPRERPTPKPGSRSNQAA